MLINILDKFSERFRVWPAAFKIHHAYVGGLLEHTLSVTKTCLYFVDKYEISKDLLVCAAILHDIGKLEELSKKSGAEYTEKGQLIGHIVLGRDIVRKQASEITDFPEDFSAVGASDFISPRSTRMGNCQSSYDSRSTYSSLC